MSIFVDAVHEDGVLKPAEPLPLGERVRVRLTIEPSGSDESPRVTARHWQARVHCQDAALIEAAALDPELDF